MTTPRTTTAGALPVDLQSICDQCGKARAHGSHKRCSKRRQAINQQKRETNA